LAVGAAVTAPPCFAQADCTDRDGDGYFVREAEADCGTLDCNDDDGTVYPGAPEICDGRDSDCDGFVDEDPACDRTCDNPEQIAEIQVTNTAGDSHRAHIVWGGDAWLLAYETRWEGTCTIVHLQKLDREGKTLAGPVVVAGGEGLLESPQRPRIAWTGSEIGVVWSDAPPDPECRGWTCCGQIRFRRYTPDLSPISDGMPLDCTTIWNNPAHPDISWARRRYGIVFSDGEYEGLKFVTVDLTSTTYPSCPIVIGPPVHSEKGSPIQPKIEWNGTYYGVAWSDQRPDSDYDTSYSDLYFRRTTEEGSVVDPVVVQITNEPAISEAPSLRWADGEWAVGWADYRTNPWLMSEIFMARLTPEGVKLDPPGDIQMTCCIDSIGDPQRYWPDLAWTGEEYGLGYREDNSGGVTGDIYFQRVDRLGNKIGNPILLTPDPGRGADQMSIAWNGKEYGLAWTKYTGTAYQVFFGRVGCNCTDNDGDTFTTCAGGDCDDTRASINPSAAERCTDGLDNNCDRKIDCQDTATCPAQGGPVPGEVAGLAFGADKQTMSWQAERRSDVYDLLTGDLGELRSARDFSRSRCLAWRVPATSYADATVPPGGAGLYYLVRGKADRCKLGTWGSTLRDQARLTCP